MARNRQWPVRIAAREQTSSLAVARVFLIILLLGKMSNSCFVLVSLGDIVPLTDLSLPCFCFLR